MDLMRRLFGVLRFPVEGDADGGDGGGDGGDAGTAGNGTDGLAGGGAGDDSVGEVEGGGTAAGAGAKGAGGEREEGQEGVDMAGNRPGAAKTGPKTMLEAIETELGYKGKAAAGDGTGKPANAGAAAGGKAEAGKDGKPTGKAAADGRAAGVPSDKGAKLGADGKPILPADKPNPLHAMPDGLQPGARERFQALVDDNKRVTGELQQLRSQHEPLAAEREQLVQQRDGFRQMLEETDTTVEALNSFLTFQAHMKAQAWDKAIAVLDAQRRHIMLQSGQDFGEVSPLDEFQDLKDRVDNHELSREDAIELARGRLDKRSRDGEAERRASTERAAQQETEVRQAEVKKIANWGREMAGKDIDYKAKQAILLPQIQAIMKKYPVASWLTAVQDAYDRIDLTPEQDLDADETTGASRPLRPSGGGGRAEPTSMAEAIDRGLGYVK